MIKMYFQFKSYKQKNWLTEYLEELNFPDKILEIQF